MVSSKIILDSISPLGNRLITVEATIHRFVLAELNTHRVFSRNSASSRAIPSSKIMDRVFYNPAVPVHWGKNQPGMSADEEIDEVSQGRAVTTWLTARHNAMNSVQALLDIGVHKQAANRLLEPFMWHTVIISSTEWENFFSQRCHPAAQPEMRAAAESIRESIVKSKPNLLLPGMYHLPYIQDDEHNKYSLADLMKISVARCARVSYLTHDGIRDPLKDVELFDKLYGSVPPHLSPFEHVATPEGSNVESYCTGNFQGWAQLRHLIQREEFRKIYGF